MERAVQPTPSVRRGPPGAGSAPEHPGREDRQDDSVRQRPRSEPTGLSGSKVKRRGPRGKSLGFCEGDDVVGRVVAGDNDANHGHSPETPACRREMVRQEPVDLT